MFISEPSPFEAGRQYIGRGRGASPAAGPNDPQPFACINALDPETCKIFFFSSRRRHTRSLRDWSSDVCSSYLDDLVAKQGGLFELQVRGGPLHLALEVLD